MIGPHTAKNWLATHSGNLMFGALQVEVCVVRWGGGAEPGHYHLFVAGIVLLGLSLSKQCVVDDFGNLVQVH